MADESAFIAKLLATFKIEAEEHLSNLNASLLALERSSTIPPSKDLLEKVFREAHSLKGAARSVNYEVIQLICQSIENVLAALKQERIKPSQVMYDILYSSLDLIGKLLEDPQHSEAVNIGKMVEKLDALLISDQENKAKEEVISSKEAKISEKKLEARKQPAESSKKELKQPIEPAKTQEKEIVSKEEPPIKKENSEPPPEKAPMTPIIHEGGSQALDRTVRVSLNKLVNLFQQAEELLTVKLTSQEQVFDLKNMEKSLNQWTRDLSQIEHEIRLLVGPTSDAKNEYLVNHFFEKHHSFIKLTRENLARLIKSTSQDYRLLGGMVDSLLDDAKKLLMQPFSTLLETFPRMVRDLSHQLNKDVMLDIQGASIEIDRRILEEMKDPLIHLIRNSIDHGIGTPEEREKKGKPRTGTIRIAASQLSSNSVEIIVSDDGKGIATDEIKHTALKQKMISQKEADAMPAEEAAMLIFHLGISTSKIVTELSGRGLGMGIVAEKVDKLGGQISLETSPKGTSVRMTLPLTLATFRGIQIKVSDRNFIMPTHNVRRVIRIKNKDINFMENRASITVEGRALSFIHLRDVLGLPTNESEGEKEWLTALVVKSGEQTVAFGADAILNEQEVLVKRFGKQLTRVRNILSATVVEKGKVVPILNPSDLVKTIISGSFTPSSIRMISPEETEIETKKILLAEDSMTTRMLLKNILEAAGYEVVEAVDGAEAFNLLKENKVNLVLTDIQMPNMDGFSLSEKIRNTEAFKDLPIILCTSLTSQEDRERGVEVGANAYIDKASFTQSLLLDVIDKLL